MLLPRKHLILFRNNNARIVAVPANQHLDHIGHTPVFNICSLAHGFFHAGIDSEIEGGYLGSGHHFGVLRKYGKCNALCVTMPVIIEHQACVLTTRSPFDRPSILTSQAFFIAKRQMPPRPVIVAAIATEQRAGEGSEDEIQ